MRRRRSNPRRSNYKRYGRSDDDKIKTVADAASRLIIRFNGKTYKYSKYSRKSSSSPDRVRRVPGKPCRIEISKQGMPQVDEFVILTNLADPVDTCTLRMDEFEFIEGAVMDRETTIDLNRLLGVSKWKTPTVADDLLPFVYDGIIRYRFECPEHVEDTYPKIIEYIDQGTMNVFHLMNCEKLPDILRLTSTYKELENLLKNDDVANIVMISDKNLSKVVVGSVAGTGLLLDIGVWAYLKNLVVPVLPTVHFLGIHVPEQLVKGLVDISWISMENVPFIIPDWTLWVLLLIGATSVGGLYYAMSKVSTDKGAPDSVRIAAISILGSRLRRELKLWQVFKFEIARRTGAIEDFENGLNEWKQKIQDAKAEAKEAQKMIELDIKLWEIKMQLHFLEIYKSHQLDSIDIPNELPTWYREEQWTKLRQRAKARGLTRKKESTP